MGGRSGCTTGLDGRLAWHPMSVLVELLTLSALVAGTLEYAILLRYREAAPA